jgi:hypothetical protein
VILYKTLNTKLDLQLSVINPPKPTRGLDALSTIHVAASKPFLSRRWDPESLDTWQPRSPPWLGSKVRCCRARGDAWVHAPLFVLTWSLYVGVSGLHGTDSRDRLPVLGSQFPTVVFTTIETEVSRAPAELSVVGANEKAWLGVAIGTSPNRIKMIVLGYLQ